MSERYTIALHARTPNRSVTISNVLDGFGPQVRMNEWECWLTEEQCARLSTIYAGELTFTSDDDAVHAAHLRPYQAADPAWEWGYVPFEAIEEVYHAACMVDDPDLTMALAEIGNWIGTIKARREGRYR